MCSYVCLLLAMAASLGAGLASVVVVHRPPVSLQREEFIMTGTFPGSIHTCLLYMTNLPSAYVHAQRGQVVCLALNKDLL